MENKTQFDTLDMFMYLWKKRKPIIIVTVAGAVLSIIISLMMPNYYKSETTLFPTTFISPATGVLHINTNQETDPLIVGDENDAERMIELLKSDYITDKIIEKYNLITHYGIAEDDKYVKTKVKKAYKGNVTFSKTPYQGISISVVDTDPIIASNISNNISILFDSLVSDMQKQRVLEMYNITKNAYLSEKIYIGTLEDSLDIYRQHGILAYYNEVERYSEAYAKAVGNNTLTKKGQQFFNEKFTLFRKYGKEAQSLFYYINELKENQARLHLNLIQTEQSLKHPITHKYIISKAKPSDKKDSPKRMFIVIFSTLAAFLFSIGLILFLDFFKELQIRIKKETK